MAQPPIYLRFRLFEHRFVGSFGLTPALLAALVAVCGCREAKQPPQPSSLGTSERVNSGSLDASEAADVFVQDDGGAAPADAVHNADSLAADGTGLAPVSDMELLRRALKRRNDAAKAPTRGCMLERRVAGSEPVTCGVGPKITGGVAKELRRLLQSVASAAVDRKASLFGRLRLRVDRVRPRLVSLGDTTALVAVHYRVRELDLSPNVACAPAQPMRKFGGSGAALASLGEALWDDGLGLGGVGLGRPVTQTAAEVQRRRQRQRLRLLLRPPAGPQPCVAIRFQIDGDRWTPTVPGCVPEVSYYRGSTRPALGAVGEKQRADASTKAVTVRPAQVEKLRATLAKSSAASERRAHNRGTK